MPNLILAGVLLLLPFFGFDLPSRVDIDCSDPTSLERALRRARFVNDVDIYLHGVCRGNFVIATDGVTLRAGTPGSGLAAPEGDPNGKPVLEIDDVEAAVRGLIVEGGEVGILVEGWGANVLLFDVEAYDQQVAVYASRGAEVRILESILRDGSIGLLVRSDAYVNLQNVVVSNHDVGIIVSDESTGTLNNTTIENNLQGGLSAEDRSDVGVNGGIFRENGGVHVVASGRSSVSVRTDVMLGSATDTTPFALDVARNSSVNTFGIPDIYGSVSGLVDSSIQLGNTVIHGDLILTQFTNAYVQSAEITGIVFCSNGSDAICRQTTTGGAFDCPSATCGPPPPGAAVPVPSVPELGGRFPKRP